MAATASRQHQQPLTRSERRWLDSLTDKEQARLVRGLNQVDRAVRGFRAANDPPVWRRAA